MHEAVTNFLQHLGAFQHIERERGVLGLTSFVQSGEFLNHWQDIKVGLQALQDNDRWESHLGSLLAAQVLIPVTDDAEYDTAMERFALARISDIEVRVRNAVAEVLGCLAAKHKASVWERFREPIMTSIQTNYERAAEVTEEAAPEDDRDQPGSPALGGGLGPASPSSLMGALLSAAYTPAVPGQGQCRHSTEGWKALESSVRCMHRIMAGAGASFASHATPDLRQLLYKCFNHMNRFVRETAFLAMTALCSALAGTAELDGMAAEVAAKLRDGLGDNWSQVRMASSRAVRELVLGVGPPARAAVMPIVLPAMCLNRYYVAEGVRVFSQETWRRVMDSQGPAQVAAHIDAVVSYYVLQSKANNHAVREAASACMAELCQKVDRAAVEPHVPAMLQALLFCFKDESWPCRDAASTAAGHAVATYAAAAAPFLPDLYRLWFEHLWDNIPSVRENAAIALGEVAAAIGDDPVQRATAWLEDNLMAAKQQKADAERFGQLEGGTRFGVARAKRDRANDVAKHTDQAMFSCGSLAPKLRSGCMDADFARPKEPWEASDGALYLLRELAPVAPELVASLLPRAAELATLSHFDQCAKLHETLWNCLPVLAQRLGKPRFKPALELFLEPMFKDLRCDHPLCECAAGKCVAALRDWIGPNVFAGRLEEWQRKELADNANVPGQVTYVEVGLPEGPKARAPGLAERMKHLPAGAPIPNLLAR